MGDDEVREVEQLVPTVPSRQAEECVHPDEQAERLLREILPEPEVDVSERPCVRNDEAGLGRGEPSEHGRWVARGGEQVAHVVLRAATERDEAAELNPKRIRHVEDPVRDDVAALVAARLLRIEGGVGEAEVVVEALGLPLGIGVGQSRAPTKPLAGAAIRAIHF